MICDVFRLPVAEESPISGGHHLTEFQEIISRFALRLVDEVDITRRAAPTYTVIDEAFNQVLLPIWNEVDRAFASTHPIWSKCVNTLFGKRIAKVKRKYFGHEQTAENFRKFKSYRLMRFERQ